MLPATLDEWTSFLLRWADPRDAAQVVDTDASQNGTGTDPQTLADDD